MTQGAEDDPTDPGFSDLLAERKMRFLFGLRSKGVTDARMLEFRWLLEELRISLFAQELRTPQPVSLKRLEKVWAQMSA